MKQIDLRKRDNISRKDFAARIGISECAAWRYEVVGRVPDPVTMKRIVSEFPDIDIESYYQGPPNPDRQIKRRNKRKKSSPTVPSDISISSISHLNSVE